MEIKTILQALITSPIIFSLCMPISTKKLVEIGNNFFTHFISFLFEEIPEIFILVILHKLYF